MADVNVYINPTEVVANKCKAIEAGTTQYPVKFDLIVNAVMTNEKDFKALLPVFVGHDNTAGAFGFYFYIPSLRYYLRRDKPLLPNCNGIEPRECCFGYIKINLDNTLNFNLGKLYIDAPNGIVYDSTNNEYKITLGPYTLYVKSKSSFTNLTDTTVHYTGSMTYIKDGKIWIFIVPSPCGSIGCEGFTLQSVSFDASKFYDMRIFALDVNKGVVLHAILSDKKTKMFYFITFGSGNGPQIAAIESDADFYIPIVIYQIDADDGSKLVFVNENYNSIAVYKVDFENKTVTKLSKIFKDDSIKYFGALVLGEYEDGLRMVVYDNRSVITGDNGLPEVKAVGLVFTKDGDIKQTGTLTIKINNIPGLTSQYYFYSIGAYISYQHIKILSMNDNTKAIVSEACPNETSDLTLLLEKDELAPVGYLPIQIYDKSTNKVYLVPIKIPEALFTGQQESYTIIDPEEKVITGSTIASTTPSDIEVEEESNQTKSSATSSTTTTSTASSSSTNVETESSSTGEAQEPSIGAKPNISIIVSDAINEVTKDPTLMTSTGLTLGGLLLLLLALL